MDKVIFKIINPFIRGEGNVDNHSEVDNSQSTNNENLMRCFGNIILDERKGDMSRKGGHIHNDSFIFEKKRIEKVPK